MKIVLPVHYTFEYKTKKNKKVLVGLNWYRNVHYISNNKVKTHFHNLVKQQYNGQKFDKVKVHYKVFVGRMNTDGHNVRSILEKYVLDALVSCGAIVDDSLRYVKGTSSDFYLDSEKPRIEIEVIPTSMSGSELA